MFKKVLCSTVAIAAIAQLSIVSFAAENDEEDYKIHDVHISVEGMGEVTPSGGVQSVFRLQEGEDVTFEFEPAAGYELAEIQIDGKSISTTDEYTFDNIDKNYTLHVVFEEMETVEAEELVEAEKANPSTGAFA